MAGGWAAPTFGRTLAGQLGLRAPLPRIIAVTTALAVLLIAALFTTLAWRDRAHTIHEKQVVAQNLAAVLAEHASRLFETADFVGREAMRLAGPPDAPIPADRATHEALARLAATAPYVLAIWIGDKDGNAVVTSREYPTPPLNAADRPYFQTVRDNPGAFYVGLLAQNRYNDVSIITTSRRIQPEYGPFRGFVQVSVSPDYLRSLYGSLSIDNDTVFWLLDGDLRPMLREPTLPLPQLLAVPTESVFASARYTDHDSFIAATPAELGDGMRLYASKNVPKYGAYVVVGIARDAALRPWHGRLWAYSLAGSGASLAVLGLGGIAWRQARRELASAQVLDRRVRERTAELERAMARLEQAVERKDVLLREVNHRVKNSLQLVSSLLALQAKQAGSGALAEGLGEAQRRVATVARVHERLHRTDKVETVAFGAYLRELCAELQGSLAETTDGRQLVVEAAEVELPTDMVAPLALAVNELITNAWKHAYPEGSGGTIAIRLARVGNTLTVAVADRGAGLPAGVVPAASSGLGMRLVQALARQLGGALRVEPGQPGTTFTIEVPLTQA